MFSFCLLHYLPSFRIMATNNKSEVHLRRQRREAYDKIRTEATSAYNAKVSATQNTSEDEHKEEELSEDSTMYLKAVIKCPLATALIRRRDLSLREVTNLHKNLSNDEAKAKALATSHEYTDEQMLEDMWKRTDTPFFPWFQRHVRRSAKRSFTPEYLMLGLMEEIGKYAEERRKLEDWPPVGKQMDEIIDRAGNLYWYIYGICGALKDVIPETVADDGYDWYGADFRRVLGPLCGAIKEYSSGGQDWSVLRPRVQTHVSRVLRHVTGGAVCPAEEAMRVNIAKIRGKKE